ncbi:MAG: hypothetical protein DCF19_13565 [Pseudanabaena frigida]|uniref:Glycosyl transferase family 1 domain-containing protein n=1 Tax=Pseudanabaena frigida TaxID=945775 RepID=A0A2W4W8K1_9CYAN|nr:MAG: hypothetical protein DCF19_13565 [Pseudanabaena frigida]
MYGGYDKQGAKVSCSTNYKKLMIKTVVLVDPRWQGHHLTYINLFTQILLQQNYQVVILCPKPDEVYQLIQKALPDKVSQLKVDLLKEAKIPPLKIVGMGALYPTLSRWYLTAIAIDKVKKKFDLCPDLIFFSWLDGYLYLGNSAWLCLLIYKLVDLFFAYQWVGLLFHVRSETNHLNSSSNQSDPYKILRSPKCQAIAILDELSTDRIEKLGKKVVIFPDIADDAPADSTYSVVQKIREKANGRQVIGLLGYLEKRKGVISLIEIAKQSTQKPWFFLFAGVLSKNTFSLTESETIIKFAESNPSNCFFWFERIPQESQFNALVKKCDVLYAVYEKFSSSSNILTKAALFEKLVLVSSGYCMESRIKEFNLGMSVDEDDLTNQINALEILLDKEEFYQKIGEPKFKEYRELHSINRLNKVFANILK